MGNTAPLDEYFNLISLIDILSKLTAYQEVRDNLDSIDFGQKGSRLEKPKSYTASDLSMIHVEVLTETIITRTLF